MIYKNLLRPVLFRFNGETAHHLAMIALTTASAIPGCPSVMRAVMGSRKAKPVTIKGLKFSNRLGGAGGWVNNGEALKSVWGFGFGVIEIGSVTAAPWSGNPKPRVKRLVADEAMINRMGLPSPGWKKVRARLESQRPRLPVLVNVAKTGNPEIHGDAAIADIVETVVGIEPVSDWIVLNLSCPNTEDGRTFENDPAAMKALLGEVTSALGGKKKLLVKLSPDKTADELSTLVDIAMEIGADGFVATNTTRCRDNLKSGDASSLPPGGLSGKPLRDRAVDVVRAVRSQVGSDPIIVGCGGIYTAEDADMFMDAGADLLEGFTGFIYEGPFYCRNILDNMQR